MPINIEVFLSSPHLATNISTLKKEDLISLANHFEITANSQMKKNEIKKVIVAKLVENGLLQKTDIEEEKQENTFQMQLEIKKLELEMQLKREEMQMQKEKEEREMQFQLKKLEIDREIELERARHGAPFSQSISSHEHRHQFDVAKHIRLVPKFSDKYVDKYFLQFEKVAENLNWPRENWTTLLQSVLQGKAAEVYSAMSVEDSSDYEKVKTNILKAYELVPEAYRQKFRNYKKFDYQTYVEFSRNQEDHFDQWLRSKNINNFDNLRNLMLIEQFKNCLHPELKTHIDEKEVKNLNEAAVLADSYTLTHKRYTKSLGHNDFRKNDKAYQPQHLTTQNHSTKSTIQSQSESHFQPDINKNNVGKTSKFDITKKKTGSTSCAYCKKPGHHISECRKKAWNESHPLGFVSENKTDSDTFNTFDRKKSRNKVMESYKPYLSDGFCSVDNTSNPIPIQILRDTGASQTLILEGTLPLSEKTALGESALLEVVQMGAFNAPLHQINLTSKFISGPVTVGVSPTLPVKGIQMLLGNDLAGGKFILIPTPIVSEKAQSFNTPDDNQDLYPACAVTRAMAQREKEKGDPDTNSDFTYNLMDTFFQKLNEKENLKASSLSDKDKSTGELSKQRLIDEQRKDTELRDLYKITVDYEDIDTEQKCFYIKNNVLMRKWRPLDANQNETWKVIHQIVVPNIYRNDILSMAHDLPMSGHLGVNKTYTKILNHFFWPKMKQDVIEYCRSCHTCQMVGKPNQNIPNAPLKPIPAFDEPFSRILIDCVGPLPKTKSGMEYLLTIMCASTRFPEAIPLRSIKTKVIVKALTKFFCFVGMPNFMQHDQGTNFMSKTFQQVTKELGIKQCPSTAYHPQSQGAIERFHQTLKSMLKKYCLEHEKDWDEGVHFALFAARNAVQDSLGFSPFELIFGHSVKGPMNLLKEKWLAENTQNNLLDYVSDFKERVFSAVKIAKENLKNAQIKMKSNYDKNSKSRSFKTGDKVLVFLPISDHSLQARYLGPFEIENKIDDFNYVIKTPGRRKEKRVCHINMIKEYFDRENAKNKSNTEINNAISTVTHANVSIEKCNDVCDVSDIDGNNDLDKTIRDNVQSAHLKNSDYLSNLDTKLSHLNASQKKQMSSLIRKYESLFPDVPTRTTAAVHDVVINDDAPPIKQHPYRLNPIKLEHLRKEVQYMLDNDIIEKSTSAWSSPCILVPKPDGSYRFVTDFRKVNNVTKTDSFPIPRIDDCIDKIGGAKFVSKFDLLKGFWQVPLTKRAKEISAFATPDGLFQYKVMPFGMKNSPATFQRMIHNVIQGLPCCVAYIDDVIIFSQTWEEHIKAIQQLFQRLLEANLTINLTKSDFVHATTSYLGHVVGQGCVKPINAKVEAISKYPAPKTKKQLMRFLGMVGFYRRFCHNFSTIVAPLTNLLQKNTKFLWTSTCDNAFNNIKRVLMNSPVLVSPDFNKQFKLAVDASDVGIGAVLYQESDDNIDRVVSFYSKKLNRYQKNYSTIEKECLGLLLSLQHFDVYLNVTLHPILVFTDHNPLTFLHKMTNKNQRLTRWSLLLQQYNMDIKHIKGTDNVIADALSRA